MPSTNPNTESKKGNVGPLSKKGTFMSKHCLSKYGEAKTGPINMEHPMKKYGDHAINMNHPMTKKGCGYK